MAPPVDVLHRYLLGSANPTELARVEAYLMTDPAAATVLAELTPEDSFLAALQVGVEQSARPQHAKRFGQHSILVSR